MSNGRCVLVACFLDTRCNNVCRQSMPKEALDLDFGLAIGEGAVETAAAVSIREATSGEAAVQVYTFLASSFTK